MATPALVGSPPGSPVMLISPHSAWSDEVVAGPARAGARPDPNPVIEQ